MARLLDAPTLETARHRFGQFHIVLDDFRVDSRPDEWWGRDNPTRPAYGGRSARLALQRAELSIGDLDVVEADEAFAARSGSVRPRERVREL